MSTMTIHGSPKLPTDLVVRQIDEHGLRVERLGLRAQGGDLVRWADGRIGMIDDATTPLMFPEWSVVEDMTTASVHLLDGGKVSISGGPFRRVHPDQLTFSGQFGLACFWNWGGRPARAHQGVDYILARPIYDFGGDT